MRPWLAALFVVVAFPALIYGGSIFVAPTSATPCGPAGGDLAGTYPAPAVVGIANATSPAKFSSTLTAASGITIATGPVRFTSTTNDDPAAGGNGIVIPGDMTLAWCIAPTNVGSRCYISMDTHNQVLNLGPPDAGSSLFARPVSFRQNVNVNGDLNIFDVNDVAETHIGYNWYHGMTIADFNIGQQAMEFLPTGHGIAFYKPLSFGAFASNSRTQTPSGTTATVDWTNGGSQKIDLSSATGTTTITLSNPQENGFYHLEVIEGGTARQVTFSPAVKWPGGSGPTFALNTTNSVDCRYDGTSYLCRFDLAYQ